MLLTIYYCVGNDVTNQLLTEHVTDVIVSWSDVIDHIELLVEGLMLSHYLWSWCYRPLGILLNINKCLSDRYYCHWGQMLLTICCYIGSRHRAKTVCSNHHLLEEEEEHLNKALSNCRYPAWALNRTRINSTRKKKTTRSHTNINNMRPYIVVPYM